jgi:hypothetical protein
MKCSPRSGVRHSRGQRERSNRRIGERGKPNREARFVVLKKTAKTRI